MIKFFRRIREQLIGNNKFSKYLLYAIGEILLVVLGILIALQLNTWNSERIQENEIRATYKSMLEEILSTKVQVQQRYTHIDSLILGRNRRSLHLMKLKNTDSIRQIYETLMGMSNVVTVSYDMPTTSEFLNDRNITSIDNPRLKAILLQIKRSLRFGDIVDNYAANQLNTIIEPYMMKNLNYAEMVRGRDMVAINTIKDYSIFFDNLELENIINLKIEADNTKIKYLQSFETVLNAAAKEINNELTNRE